MSNRYFPIKKRRLVSFDLIKDEKATLLSLINSSIKEKNEESFETLLNSVKRKGLNRSADKLKKTKYKLNESLL